MPRRTPGAAFWLYAGHLYTLFGIALSNALGGLALLTAPFALRRRGVFPPPVPAVAAPRRWLAATLGLYVATLALAVATSHRPAVSAGALAELLNLATLPLGVALVRGEARVRQVVDGVGAVGGLVAVAGLAQFLAGFGDIERRIRGPFSHWMTFSGFLLLCDLLLFASLLFGFQRLRRRGAWPLVWRLGALLAINAALLGSLTRSAWVGLAVGLLLLVTLRAPRALAALPVAAVVFVLLAPVPLLHRVLSTADLSDPSNYDRLAMASAGAAMIAEHPLTGQGPDLVEERYPIYRPPSAVRYWVPHLHDNLLQLGAERGLGAVAVFLALMAVPLVAAVRLYRAEGGRHGPRCDLLLGAVAALVAFNVAGLFEYNWGDTEVQRLALFVMALPFCLGATSTSRRPSRASRNTAEGEPPPAILAS
jgi:O-antigen ligase